MKHRWWVLIWALALSSQSMGAGIYKWVDEQGNVQYTQTPPPDKPASLFETRPEPVDTEGALEKLKQQKDKSDAFIKERDTQAKEQEKSEQEAAQRSENCARARKNLEQLETTNRLFRTGEAGDRVKMTEEERQAGLTTAKSQIEEFCKKKAPRK
ncbi:MAG: DUF4124 domain-containing protein [Gammaproteobacteria bacterium]